MTQEYLYFPECKIVKAQLVPKSNLVISFYIKSLKNTPKHYPNHPLLDGKAEFYFGLELTDNFKDGHKHHYFDLFSQSITESVNKLIGKKLSTLILFNPHGDKKLDTIGLGKVNDKISLYNDYWTPEEIKIVSQASKLLFELPSKNKTKKEKI